MRPEPSARLKEEGDTLRFVHLHVGARNILFEAINPNTLFVMGAMDACLLARFPLCLNSRRTPPKLLYPLVLFVALVSALGLTAN